MAQATASEMSSHELQVMLHTLFGKKPEPQLSKENTALLIIDMQYVDAHPDYGLGARGKKLGLSSFLDYYWSRMGELVIPNIQHLLDAARRAGIEVIHSRVASQTEDSRDTTRRYKAIQLRQPIEPKEAVFSFLQPIGSKVTEFLPEVAPQGDELVFNKLSASVFDSTNIDRMLRNMGIRNLIITGVVTNGCVESSTRSASEHDYDTIVVEDATAAIAPQRHEHAIRSMGSLQIANIKSTTEVVKLLEAL